MRLRQTNKRLRCFMPRNESRSKGDVEETMISVYFTANVPPVALARPLRTRPRSME